MGKSMMDDVSSELRRYCREGTANRGVCCGASVADLATDCKLETANGIPMVVHLMCAGYSTRYVILCALCGRARSFAHVCAGFGTCCASQTTLVVRISPS